ncbi:hypothetical protein [Thiolapillus brandeum]|nr:hypothetical protein [Thiolapillus brandeum]
MPTNKYVFHCHFNDEAAAFAFHQALLPLQEGDYRQTVRNIRKRGKYHAREQGENRLKVQDLETWSLEKSKFNEIDVTLEMNRTDSGSIPEALLIAFYYAGAEILHIESIERAGKTVKTVEYWYERGIKTDPENTGAVLARLEDEEADDKYQDVDSEFLEQLIQAGLDEQDIDEIIEDME